MISILGDAMMIAGKDLKNELKTKQTIGIMLVFSALGVLVFSFAFDPVNSTVQAVIPGLVWVITIFSGLIGLNRSFVSELENDCLIGLRLAPIDLTSIYIGKVIANLVMVSFVQVISIPLLFLLFGYRFAGSCFWFILVIFCGTYGFIVVGTFLAALAANAKNSEMLLPVLLLPLISPLMIAAVQATKAAVETASIGYAGSWLRLIAGYDLLFTAICFLLFEFVMEDSL
ncbi:MAG: heme exporter protein CcmB [Thermoactinomyces sp.]